MRTLLSSILILGMTAQPILAQGILSEAEKSHAIRIGQKICAIELKTGTPVSVLLNEEYKYIPSNIKKNSAMLDEYYEVQEDAYLTCHAENILRQLKPEPKNK